MKLLVTGGAGFIGSAVIRLVLSKTAAAGYETPTRGLTNLVPDSGKLGCLYGIAPCDWRAALDRLLGAVQTG